MPKNKETNMYRTKYLVKITCLLRLALVNVLLLVVFTRTS